jgi:prepilin-type N-terminal cleavage/methylation domain-containing protein
MNVTFRAIPTRRSGFSLMELLVVIAIIALLLALIIPMGRKARERGQQMTCTKNMQTVSAGILLYPDKTDGFLPESSDGVPTMRDVDWVWGGHDTAFLRDPNNWDNPPPKYGFHAEQGSVFTYVTGLPQHRPGGIAANGNGTIDYSVTTIFPSYRCPSTGPIGKALRVNFSMNGWINQNHRLSSVRGPAHKILLTNEDPLSMKNAALHPGGTADDPVDGTGNSLHVTHDGKISLSFLDGHMAFFTSKQIYDMQSNSILSSNGVDVNREYWFNPIK